MRRLKKVTSKCGVSTKKPVVEQEPWQPKYTPELPPGRKQQKQMSKRRTSKTWEVIDNDDAFAIAKLEEMRFLWKPLTRQCPVCKQGSMRETRPELFRCKNKACGQSKSLWKGSAWFNSAMSARPC